ncbi:hypothetical protein AWB81_07952 [Caballeronia arationis]|nr:hypothetical protein AWB81_07952 [Caballeronia arationis]
MVRSPPRPSRDRGQSVFAASLTESLDCRLSAPKSGGMNDGNRVESESSPMQEAASIDWIAPTSTNPRGCRRRTQQASISVKADDPPDRIAKRAAVAPCKRPSRTLGADRRLKAGRQRTYAAIGRRLCDEGAQAISVDQGQTQHRICDDVQRDRSGLLADPGGRYDEERRIFCVQGLCRGESGLSSNRCVQSAWSDRNLREAVRAVRAPTLTEPESNLATAGLLEGAQIEGRFHLFDAIRQMISCSESIPPPFWQKASNPREVRAD